MALLRPKRAQPGDHGDDRDADEGDTDIFRPQVDLYGGADLRHVQGVGELDRPTEKRSAGNDDVLPEHGGTVLGSRDQSLPYGSFGGAIIHDHAVNDKGRDRESGNEHDCGDHRYSPYALRDLRTSQKAAIARTRVMTTMS